MGVGFLKSVLGHWGVGRRKLRHLGQFGYGKQQKESLAAGFCCVIIGIVPFQYSHHNSVVFLRKG